MIAPARVAAYRVLSDLSSNRSDLPSAIARVRETLVDERDRALAADIATGVERWRAALDYLIVHFSKRAIDRLDPEVVDVLRLSLYQLLHLTRVPASAVVDDAVALTGKAGKKSAGGFVNAILRGVSRKRDALPLPPRPIDEFDRRAALDYLSITCSHPLWLAKRWYDRLGFGAAEAWVAFNNQPAPLTLRANPLRGPASELQTYLAGFGISTVRTRFAPLGLNVESGHPLREPGVESGWFVVQDEASQLITLLAGEHPGPLVLDTCASPGGKATAIAASLGPSESVVACDIRERRMALLKRTVRAMATENVRLVQADVTTSLPFSTRFNTVIVDAPCSGLGTLRRDPDIRWRRDEADLAPLAQAQRQMLANAAAAVAPGGRLVYATCSSEPEENEDVAAAFLRETSGFRPVDAHRTHPTLAAAIGDSEAVVDFEGHLRTTPHRHGLECFFGAVFERARQL